LACGTLLWFCGASALLTSAARDAGDPWVAHYMWRRYFNTTANCPNDRSAPEYSCTGILLRATSPGKEPDGAWVPEHKSFPTDPVGHTYPSAGGVSFSYIRADSKFGRLAFDFENGFTLYPATGKYAQPPGKTRLTVLCAFFLDASTDNRAVSGCGPRQGLGYGRACRLEGMDTAVAVMNSYYFYVQKSGYQVSKWAHEIQCGFDMRDGVRQPADFSAILALKQATDNPSSGPSTFAEVNELRIQTWAPDYPTAANAYTARVLPVESFFYIVGTAGLGNARLDQEKYYRLTGMFVPIVQITMPQSRAENFDFHYSRTDQNPAVPIPPFPAQDPLPCTQGNFDTVC
jgi:hypothetical protein